MPTLDQKELEKILGIKIKNTDLYLSAFTHRSYLNENRFSICPTTNDWNFWAMRCWSWRPPSIYIKTIRIRKAS